MTFGIYARCLAGDLLVCKGFDNGQDLRLGPTDSIISQIGAIVVAQCALLELLINVIIIGNCSFT